jgi:mevalonate kinase
VFALGICKKANDNNCMLTYRAHGKLLITGEYLLLHGAEGLALPLTKMKQTMSVIQEPAERIQWKATNEQGKVWVDLNLDQDFQSNHPLSENELRLKKILSYVAELKPQLFQKGLMVQTSMNFSPDWGFGSSSTLISLLSQWSGLDAQQLQERFFGGSGYDIACATSQTPLLYQLKNGRPQVAFVSWQPEYRQNIRFVYRGKKKNSQDAIERFRKDQSRDLTREIQEINLLTEKMLKAISLAEFQSLIEQHEKLLSSVLNLIPVQKEYFSDFPGAIKSLGAWGGDFILAASNENMEEYFRAKGNHLIFKWSDLVEET